MNQIAQPTPLEIEVCEVLVAVTGKEPGIDENLFEKGLLDSLKLVSLILMLEQKFSLPLAEEEINFDHYQSVRRIAHAVQKLQSAPAGEV